MKNSLCLRKAVLGAFVIAAVFFSRASLAAEVTGASTQKVVQNYGKLVLAFEANQGQTNGQVKFLSHGKGYTLFLTPTEAVLKGTSTLRMELVGARRDSRMVGLELLPGKSNYLIGKDPNKWKRNIPSYARVKQEGVYPGIDVVYYGNQGELEYDFIVAPGADPKAINLVFHEADRAAVDADGSLVLQVASSEVKFRRPVVYQERDGVRTPIAGGYILNPKPKIENRSTEAHNRSPKSLSVGFQVAAYDHARPLVIDPVLVYSTYLGGSGNEGPFEGSITVDVSGSAYITGFTPSSDFPLAAPYQSTYGGGTNDAFIVKLSPDGSQLIYSTYLGGSGDDQAVGITVDAAGYAYVAGSTASTDFPTVNPLQAAHGGGSEDAFITKLDPTGSTLIYSTYLGGSANDGGRGIGLDTGGNVYVSGATTSPDFPLANPIQSVCGGFPACSEDFFVAKLNAQGDQLLYSTYLGGSNLEQNYGSLAVDNLGNAYVAGGTQSSDFPTVNPFQSGYGGGPRDAFVAKLKTDGSALVYSTYLGGSRAEQAFSVAVDAVGNAYVSGATGSSADFPLKNPLQPAHGGGNQDGFVAKLTASGALVYSTYLGGSGEENSRGIAVDAAGQARVTGVTSSTDFPTVNAFQPVYGGGINDGYIVALNAAGSALLYSTYFGGSGHDRSRFIALDSLGNAYVTGWTDSADFPTMNPLQPTLNGPGDIFIAKIGAPVLQVTIDIKPGSFPNSINLGSKGTTPVAILSSASFDAATVDPTTVTLAGAPVASRGKGRSMASTEDVNGDALPDLVVHVSTEALHLSKADTLAVLEGQTFAGMPIRGADSVRIVP